MLDFFRGRLPWGKFWRLLEQISKSSDSRYAKAQQDDPDLAARIAAESTDDGPPWAPALADWSLQHELLSQIRDRLGHVASLLADLPIGVKQRHSPPPDFPRPVTALDTALAEAKEARERAYDDRIQDFAERAKARWRAMQERQGDGDGDGGG